MSCWVCFSGGTDGWWTSTSYVHEKILYGRVKRFNLANFVISYLQKSTLFKHASFISFYSPYCQKRQLLMLEFCEINIW